MNYRHEYHAGNFADVFKHIILVRIIEHLKSKEKAFRVVDTHAGSGRYLLPERTATNHRGAPPEWVNGIGRLDDWRPTGPVLDVVEPYLNLVRHGSAEKESRFYPGSPLVALGCMRKQDRLTACELHPEAHAALKSEFAGNFQARILNLDGWLVPGSQIPPKEKRGVMLIDPPFEETGDFDRMADAITIAAKRWRGGTVALWYPLKHQDAVTAFKDRLKMSGVSDLASHELEIAKPGREPRLYGCGMIIRNAPFRLAAEMETILPELVPLLAAEGGQGTWSIRELTPEA